MFNNTDLKYKIHILTTLNNEKINVIHKNLKYENDFISQSIDNLKEIIENLLENNIYQQFKSLEKLENDKFQCLLNYIKQLLLTFKNQYCNNHTSKSYLNTKKPQQQIANDIMNSSPNISNSYDKNLHVHKQNLISNFEENLNEPIQLLRTMTNTINNSHVYDDRYDYEKKFTLPNLSLHVNNYSSSIKTDISHRIFSDKDDYPQIEKQELKLVNSVVNRINEINDNIEQITNKLDKIHPLIIKQIMIDIITQINFLNKSIDINQFSKFKTFIIPIENNLQNHTDKYEQESLHLFSKKINKRNLKQRFKYSLSSKLRNFRRIFMQRISLSKKNNGTIFPITNDPSPRFLSSSTLNIPSFSSNPSSIDIHTFCRQTYDRSTSAYTSKKRSHRHNSSFRGMKDEIDQSTPTNILSRVAKKLDENEIDLMNNRDYLTESNTFKYKSPKYKYYSSQKTHSNSSDIYIKLSDCQAACRRWAAKHNKRDQSDLFSSYASPHYRTKKDRHRKSKIPICYRDFPLSLNALSKYSNTRKRYINRYHVKPTDHQFIIQTKSDKDIQTKISVDIGKVSYKNIHSAKKVHDSFICFGTGSIDFVHGPNGPILCLKQEDSKNDEQVCLYRRISNNELDFGDGYGDEQKQQQQIFKQVDELVIDSSESIASNSTLVSAHILREENDFDTSIKLKISLLDELASCILYQSPFKTTLMFDVIPACVLTIINSVIRMSIIQLASLPSIISESDAANLWRYKSSLNIRLIDTNRNVQDQQNLKIASLNFVEDLFYNSEVILDDDDRDQSKISQDLIDLENQKYAHKDDEDNVVILQERGNMKESDQDSGNKEKNEKEDLSSNQGSEPLSSTHSLIIEKKISTSNAKDDGSMILNDTWDDTELLLYEHENVVSSTKTGEHQEEQNATFIVDYDRNISNGNLIDNEKSNDEGNNRDLSSRIIIRSNQSVDRSFKIETTINGTNEQETIPNSKSSKISLISYHINHRSISQREDNEIPYSNANSSTIASFQMKEDQLLENLEEISIEDNQSLDKTLNQSDGETASSLLAKLSHSLKSNGIFEHFNDHSINNLQPVITGDEIYSPISTSYIDDIRSRSITNQYQRIDEATVTLSKEKQQTFDEPNITIPTCVHRYDSFEQTSNQSFDPLLSTATIPKYSSTSLETKVSLSCNEKSTFPERPILQNSDEEHKSSDINVYQNEETSLKHVISLQSKTFSSKTYSSGLKHPPLMTTSLSKRKTSFDNVDLHSLRQSSELTDRRIQQFDTEKQSNDKIGISRIMTIPRKMIDNNSISVKKLKRHYIKNQLSDLQSKTHKVHVDQLMIGSSPPASTNPINCKHKNKFAVIPIKHTRRQKLIRKNQICIRPPWISPNENRLTNNYPIHKPINRTSVPLKQLRDSCQILDLYTRFKRIHGKPYECVCTPLPPCCDISPCSFIKNAQIHNVYSMQNNKI